MLVGARDELWRGARAGHHSIYLHSSRPLVGENGSSPVLRELVHVFAQINDRQDSDWIGESLAEYYASELLRRAGGMTEERYQAQQASLERSGKKVSSLRGEQVDSAVIARGVLLLRALDQEIRLHTHNQRSLDDVTRAMMRLNSVSTEEFIQLSESVLGRSSEVLQSKLLR
ncbi:hypothetical protein D3C79_640430 [compost metagenome]